MKARRELASSGRARRRRRVLNAERLQVIVSEDERRLIEVAAA